MIVMVLNLSGCTNEINATDLMEDIVANKITASSDLSSQNDDVTDFAIRLFNASDSGNENTLISPLSVLYALSMTANGARAETLEQIESVLGISVEDLNLYLYSYMNSLPDNEKSKLSLANSVWFNEDKRFKVNQNFLQTNADYYSADIYKTPFNNETCDDINNWINQKTDGMITEVLDNIPAEAIMYLINALAFEAEWESAYEKSQVKDGKFTNQSCKKTETEFMYNTEHRYLEDKNAKGFIKYYENRDYAFVAMLPNEGISVSEYMESLDGEALNNLLNNPIRTTVYTSIPKFETGFDVEMSKILKSMGMTDAFDQKSADFKNLGTSTDGNIYIYRVLHKTFISVAEKGTKAGAATIFEATDKSSSNETEKPKQVYLDRPFVYMIVDCENNIPLFIGTMLNIE